jgi:hypothetical protein
MKRNLRSSLVLLLAFLGAGAARSFAQQPATKSSASEQDNADRSKQNLCAVAGTVLRASTGEPLKKARVILSSRGTEDSTQPFVAISDASGHFAFDGVPPGRYDMRVDRTGFVPQRYAQDDPEKPGAILTLRPGQKMTDLLFRLQSAGVITGHISDEDGDPAEGVIVTILRRMYSRGGPQVRQVARGERTNDLGEYRIYGLAPGRYYVLATWGRPLFDYDRREEAAMSYVPTYYPGTTDASRATFVLVTAGAEIPGIDFLLSRNRTYRIRGHVANAVGCGSLRNIFVGVTPRSEDLPGTSLGLRSVDSKTGNFEISGIPSGSYVLRVTCQDEGNSRESSQPVDVANADVDNVGIVLGPGVDVSGHVVIEGKLASETLRVGLTPRQPTFAAGRPDAEVKADSSFVLSGVSDGTFSVEVGSSCQACYIKSATVNGQDILEQGLQISSGTAPGPVEILYSTFAGSFSGVVTRDDGLPAAGALVVLVPDPPHRKDFDRYERATTDQYGAFTMAGVPPGSYKAFAWEKMESAEYEDPEFLKAYEGKGESLGVEENGKATLQLKLLPAAADQ